MAMMIWEHRTAKSESERDALGQEGWEAYGVIADPFTPGAMRWEMKRSIDRTPVRADVKKRAARG